jgi:hypothetical protein
MGFEGVDMMLRLRGLGFEYSVRKKAYVNASNKAFIQQFETWIQIRMVMLPELVGLEFGQIAAKSHVQPRFATQITFPRPIRNYVSLKKKYEIRCGRIAVTA